MTTQAQGDATAAAVATRKLSLFALTLLVLMHPTDPGRPAAQELFAEPAVTGGIQVYAKVDFAAVDGSFQAAGSGALSLEAPPAPAVSDITW